MGKVSIFDKQTSPFFPELTQIIDIRDKVQLENKLKGFDLVIHLAAEHKDDVYPVSLYYDVNVTGTKNILDAMILNSIHRILFFSSVAVFGLNKPNPDENFPKDPFNHYGKSKLKAENAVEEWLKADKQGNAVIIRPTVIFGERNRGNVYTLIKQISSGKFMQIGKGDNKKSMAYVGNIVDFVKFNIEKVNKDCLIYNYVDKPDITINELIKVVQDTLNIQIPPFKIPYFLGYTAGKMFDFVAFLTRRKLSISSVRIKKVCATTQFDSSKMQASGFIPPYKLIKGLERTINYEFVQKRDDDVIFISE
jgi:nucleoside-diphosphate-sugar epimerase